MNRLGIRRLSPHLLAAFCLVTAWLGLLEGPTPISAPRTEDYPVSSWDERMREVRAALPADVSAAGYVERSYITGGQVWLDQAEFAMTQYGLAPVVLRLGTDQTWIVGRFGLPITERQIKRRLDAELEDYTIQRFGSGIYLIRVLRE